MKVLMITGDKNIFKSGTSANKRFKLQESQVNQLIPVYWGRGALLNAFRVRGLFDLVTAQDPFWRGLVGWIVARQMKARFNVQVHANLFIQAKIRRALSGFILRRADSIRVVSQKIKKQAEAMKTNSPIHVLPIYIELDRFHNIEHKQHSRFKKTILWLGRFEPEKDPLKAVKVLREVRDSGIDAGLIMLGKGSLESKLKSKTQELSSYIQIVNWQDPLPYFQIADVVLSTSRYESWGASIVEALAASVPVVAPDVGVAREAGAIVVSRDKLAEAMTKILNNNIKGELRINLLSEKEWGEEWRKTL